jgi:hypothetical protein
MPEQIQYAGQFQIELAEILSSSGKSVGIEPNLMSITLYEDIDRPWIEGECLLHNQAALSSITPLMGQEYFRLILKTPTLPGKIESTIDYSENVFFVYNVGKLNVGTGTETVTFSFISGEAIKNRRVLISEKLEGSCDAIVNQMLDRVGCLKERWIEPSSGNKKIIAPNITPFEVISKMEKQAITNEPISSPNFLFWESFRGYHFRSLDSCFSRTPSWFYNVKPDSGSWTPADGTESIMENLETILTYGMSNNNQMEDQMAGMLNSNLIVHDITKKSYTKHGYNYFNEFPQTNTTVNQPASFPVYSRTPVVEEGGGIADIGSTPMLMPNATLPFGAAGRDSQHLSKNGLSSYEPYSPQKWSQRRQSHMHQMYGTLGLNMMVHGNTVISCGDMVEVNIPHHAELKATDGPKLDRINSGRYFIRRIEHTFTLASYTHEMNMTLYKNGLTKELEEVEDAYEPTPDNVGNIYNRFYDESNSGW